eukprot:CAMPEP_0119108186 /NCGR_PEP_ID=MMETSP1180-20130426/13516_1 /TAXON_ID=3052 ORGANISM="Chlamydomonas cf sp, Strain CCMP681" /NCGR_SAMPLE_ID=MMETSP1180 /ASSEMBLY_ACC=CAM_ASM_000741 /LENGTH=374 /DNA_ID=CAMNT_0007093777 /DNA_START=23 /DNA_END=1147 /DNA_ORIENTATION=+
MWRNSEALLQLLFRAAGPAASQCMQCASCPRQLPAVLHIGSGFSSSASNAAEARMQQGVITPSSSIGNLFPGRRRVSRTKPPTPRVKDIVTAEASGPKIQTTAPWPWVDPLRPWVLPQQLEGQKSGPVSMLEAVRQLKGNLTAALQGTQAAMFSGRQRGKASADEAVELNLVLNIDPRQPDQIVRGTTVLPHGRGRAVRVGVFASGAAAEAARAAGAHVVGGEELIQKIIETNGAVIDFDRLVATPAFMRPLAAAGRVLGPRGLMPNPKMGTLTSDVAGAVREMLAGKLEYRVGRDKQMQLVVGLASFSERALHENLSAIMTSLLENRPMKLPGKGVYGYITRMYIKSTQTPVISVNPATCILSARSPPTPFTE